MRDDDDDDHRTIATLLDDYRSGELDLEDARDAIHLLDPATAAEVLAAAEDPAMADVHDLCVTVLVDHAYPPAFPLFRRLLEHADHEAMAIPAAIALDAALGDRFGSGRLYEASHDVCAAAFVQIAAAWDRGEGKVPDEAAWLAALRAEQRAYRDARLPPPPVLSPMQTGELAAAVGELARRGDRLRARDPLAVHAFEARAVARVLPLVTAFAPDERRVADAHAVVERFVAGEVGEDALVPARELAGAAVETYRSAARWNPFHRGHEHPPARAPEHVAQATWYLCSAEARNRLAAMHYCRDALEWSGAGFAAVERELAWQLAEMRKITPEDDPPRSRWRWPWSRR